MRHATGSGANGAVTYLAADHLGSVSLAATVDAGTHAVTVVSETRYKPFGEVHWTGGASMTDFGYTGQRLDGFGLMDYHARYYSPYISQFSQPDLIIQDQYNPLDWNRYAYVRWNPINHNDPTGLDVGCSAADPKCHEQNSFDEVDRLLLKRSLYSDWNSENYGGCLKCHAAVATGNANLTNKQLSTAQNNLQEWEAVGYSAILGPTLALGGADVAATLGGSTAATIANTTKISSPVLGKQGVDVVMKILNDPNAQREVPVYVQEAGKRANLFARFDILTQTAIHEVKNVTDLSLSQNFMEQVYKYKTIADGTGLELHYWLLKDAPNNVVNFLQNLGIIVH